MCVCGGGGDGEEGGLQCVYVCVGGGGAGGRVQWMGVIRSGLHNMFYRCYYCIL